MPKRYKRKSFTHLEPHDHNFSSSKRLTKSHWPVAQCQNNTSTQAGTINFDELLPRIDSICDDIQREYRKVPGLILTEDDLKCILYNKLASQPELSCRARTRDRNIHASSVHAEVPWFDESWRLRIKPDITIIEPRHVEILRYRSPRLHWDRNKYFSEGVPRPSKQFGINGKALTFELKFARRGITDSFYRLVRMDYAKIQRLFSILDSRGEGDSVYSYLVILNKYKQNLDKVNLLTRFLEVSGSSYRHKIIYITGRFRRSPISYFTGSGSFSTILRCDPMK
jgi:hypothetical protein